MEVKIKKSIALRNFELSISTSVSDDVKLNFSGRKQNLKLVHIYYAKVSRAAASADIKTSEACPYISEKL
jgi:hypothetical protein